MKQLNKERERRKIAKYFHFQILTNQ